MQDIESQRDRYKAHVSSLIKELQQVFSHPYDELSAELGVNYDRLKPQDFFNAGGVSHYSCSS